MSNPAIPFNIDILTLTPEKLQGIKPVTALDTFDNTGVQFHEEGLYSTSIFGRSGDEIRDYRFSYIDIKVDVFHPILFKCLCQLKSLYQDIMSGKEYAIWNDKEKDFEKSTVMNGETGYHFFMTHWKNINFKKTESDLREQYILLVNKFKDVATTNKIVVMPAGLRDIEFSDTGRVEENEINKLYRKLISISNVVTDVTIKTTPEILNSARWSLQVTFNDIFEMLQEVIEGKKKLVLGKWASRAVFNSTRNVITAMEMNIADLDDPLNVTVNHSLIGLFQTLKAVLPKAKYLIKNGILSKIFISKDIPVRLVNKKTLKSEDVRLKLEYFDRWASDDGIDKIIESFREEYLRHKVIEISDHYLALVYKGPDNTFKVIYDIDEVPEGRDKKDVYPITLAELLYLSIYSEVRNIPIFITRYPVAGVGSIQPSYIYLKSTVRGETRVELDDDWKQFDGPDAIKHKTKEFPINGLGFFNSLSPNLGLIAGLVADKQD